MITEYGVDSYCGSNVGQGEALQAATEQLQWQEIAAHMNVVSGALLFSYTDGWYKCSGGSLTQQETCPYTNTAFPCSDVNEEYFGIVAFVNGPVAPDGGDQIRMKESFCRFKHAWKDYPRLVSWTPTNISNCPVYPEAQVIEAEADSYVQDGSNSGTNYGTAPLLIVKYAADPGFRRESYLRFDLNSLSTSFTTATLKLNVQNIDRNELFSFQVGVVSADWQESSITWNNKPTSSSPLTIQRALGATTISLDITQVIHFFFFFSFKFNKNQFQFLSKF